MSKPREIWLLVTPSKRSRAHWAIEVPGRDGVRNKRIHVTGSQMHGFHLEFKHNYDPTSTRTRKERHFLGYAKGPVVDFTESLYLTNSSDPLPGDVYETVAARIPPPPKLGPEFWPTGTPSQIVSGWAALGSQGDCQTWARTYVAQLIVDNLLPPTALEVLDSAVSAPTSTTT